MKHGKGVYNYHNNEVYDGLWVNNKKSGDNGVYTYNNGDVYTGRWVEDTCQGKGVLVTNNGDKYIGTFWKGQRGGRG